MSSISGGIPQISAKRAATTIANGTTLFTITGGPIAIEYFQMQCETANGAVASTVQFSSTPTFGSAKAFTGASASLISATAGTTVTLNGTALTTAPDVVTGANGGVALGANVANSIIVEAGTITCVVTVGTMTGTWATYISFRPLAPGIAVT